MQCDIICKENKQNMAKDAVLTLPVQKENGFGKNKALIKNETHNKPPHTQIINISYYIRLAELIGFLGNFTLTSGKEYFRNKINIIIY